MDILIADDDFTSRSILTSVLKKGGHQVTAAVDGAQAWEILQQPGAPRLVILDWIMPKMDGLEVVRRMRANSASRPFYVIMLTSRGEKDDLVAGLESGADDYLTKPFDSVELHARIAVGRRVLVLQERLAAEASTDELTRLLNRRAGLDLLRREIARSCRSGHFVGVGMLDVDHFKKINDTYGHPVGDDVLQGLADRLRAVTRPYDHVIRYGGEEFLVVAPGATSHAFWERLRQEVAGSSFPTRIGDLAVTVSIGHVSRSGPGTPEELIALADKALYRAKETGRNRVVGENAAGDRLQSSFRDDPILAGVSNRILIAEDDATSRRILAELLKKGGFDVLETGDGVKAWEALQQPGAPRLVILDWMMPKMDGLDVLQQILKMETNDPPYVIMLTARGEKTDAITALKAGADDFLTKPFDSEELQARIDVGKKMISLRHHLSTRVRELQRALDQINVLEGILPICSYCKRIRKDDGYWEQVESYVSKHSNANFSHGICPECEKTYFADML